LRRQRRRLERLAVGTTPVNDNRVRQALKLSLDRTVVISVAYATQAFASPDAWVAMGDPFMTPELIAATKMDRTTLVIFLVPHISRLTQVSVREMCSDLLPLGLGPARGGRPVWCSITRGAQR
jgi:hypothetical protein